MKAKLAFFILTYTDILIEKLANSYPHILVKKIINEQFDKPDSKHNCINNMEK